MPHILEVGKCKIIINHNIEDLAKINRAFIGITGQIGSGKSALAAIMSQLGYSEMTFAEPLKKIALALGFNSDNIYGSQAQKMEIDEYWGVSPRHFMQKFGTEICRQRLPEVIPEMSQLWCRALIARYNKSEKKPTVVSDVRFVDEAAIIRENGGSIIRIIRDLESAESSEIISHKSETEMSEIKADIVIYNNGTLEDLEKNINQMLKIVCIDL